MLTNEQIADRLENMKYKPGEECKLEYFFRVNKDIEELIKELRGQK